MKFTESKFHEAVSILQKMAGGRSENEQRRAKRMKVNFIVQIRTISGETVGKKITAQLRDLSARGLSAILNEPIYEGTSFMVELPTAAGAEQPLVCRVAHSVAQMDGTYVVGAEFVGVMAEKSTAAGASAEEERIRKSILG